MKKAQSGSRRKCDTKKHRKIQKRNREKRRETREQQAAAREIERVHNEAEFAKRNFAKRDDLRVCPLCNLAITRKDMKGNIKRIQFDHKDVYVHRTCPGEEGGS